MYISFNINASSLFLSHICVYFKEGQPIYLTAAIFFSLGGGGGSMAPGILVVRVSGVAPMYIATCMDAK